VNCCLTESMCSVWFSTRVPDSPSPQNAAVTFDLWQTLIFETDGSSNSLERRKRRTEYTHRELNRLGRKVDIEIVNQGFKELSEEITAGHDHGFDAPYEAWVSKLIERLAPGIEQKVGTETILLIGKMIDMTFIEAPPILLDGTLEVLNELSSQGLKIGLISNTGLTSPEMYKEWFQQVGILDRFDFLAFSNEQTIAKPDSTIFETTMAGLKINAVRALHVGDNIHTDVAGAAAVGMSTVWVRGGIDSPILTETTPNFEIDSIIELPTIVNEWLYSLTS